jgi:hypothetical protein
MQEMEKLDVISWLFLAVPLDFVGQQVMVNTNTG